jgi:hypothetical protein
MVNIIPSSYLPVASQPWGREIQKRLESLESNFSLQKTNTNTVDSQLQSSYKRLDETVRSLSAISVDISDVTALSNQAISIANNSIAGLNSLALPGSLYPVNAANVLGNVTPQDPNTNADAAKSVGYVGLPQIILSTGVLEITKAHAGKHIYVTNSGQIIRIPSNSAIPLEIGTTIVVINANFTSTIEITSDTLRLAGSGTTGTRTVAAWGVATIVKITSTSWIAYGTALS